MNQFDENREGTGGPKLPKTSLAAAHIIVFIATLLRTPSDSNCAIGTTGTARS